MNPSEAAVNIRPRMNDLMEVAARRLTGWRLTVSKLHRWVESDDTIDEGRAVLVQSEPIAGAWVIPDPWAPGMPEFQRPRDPRLLRCVVEGRAAYDYVEMLDLVDRDLGEWDGRDPFTIPSLGVYLLHVDLPSFVPARMAAVALGEYEVVAGRTFTELDFEIRPPWSG